MNRRCMGCMEVYDDTYALCPHCGYIYGTPAKEAYHIQPGSKLKDGRYTVGRVLGFGGFGVTYIGYDEQLLNKVAIKEYLPGEFSTRMPNQQAVTVYTGEREEQFNEGKVKTLDEARRLAKFQNEPNIVHVYDFFEANNTAYIIMEYCDGQSLKEIMAENGPFSVDDALQIVLQVIAGMKQVHKEGMIHRDIAPDNIYLLKDGSIKILDFGAARYATTKHSKSLSVIIKPGYAPEEQYRSRGDQGPWTDVYALAATFYKMITGTTPPDAMERGVKDLLKKPSKMGVSIPKGMETALLNALNVAIEDRTASMEEFEQELLAADVKAKEVHDRREDVGSVSGRVKIGAAIGGLVAAAGIAFALLLSPASPVKEFILPDNKVFVPNLVNQNSETAAEIAAGEFLAAKVVEGGIEYSDTIDEGKVIWQSEDPGSQVETNKHDSSKWTVIGMRVSGGPEITEVPAVMRLSEGKAVEELKKRRLKAEIVYVSRPDMIAGTVLSQDAPEKTKKYPDNSIVLEVVKDEGQLKLGDTLDIPVPDVKGKNYEEAERILKAAGLTVTVEIVNSDTVPKDEVMAQDPEPGIMAAENQPVALQVSGGKETRQVPQIMFMTREKAEEALRAEGFVPDPEPKEAYSSSVDAGLIMEQSPKAQEFVEIGTVVTFTISKGEDPAVKKAREQQAKENKPAQTQAPAPQQTQAPAPQQTQAPAPQQTQAPAPPPTEAPAPPPTQAPAPPPTEAPAPAPADDPWSQYGL